MLGLESGAVDYVVKPFRLAELLARVRSHLRLPRMRSSTPTPGPTRDAVVVGDVTIDRGVAAGARRRATRSRCDRRSSTCSRCWPATPGVVVTREQLIDDVWDENWWGSTKTLDVHINSIRRKLGEQPGGPSRITTIRGVGYRLDGRDASGEATRSWPRSWRDGARRAAFFVPAALAIRSRTSAASCWSCSARPSIVAPALVARAVRRPGAASAGRIDPDHDSGCTGRRHAGRRGGPGDGRRHRAARARRQLRRGVRRRRSRRRRARASRRRRARPRRAHPGAPQPRATRQVTAIAAPARPRAASAVIGVAGVVGALLARRLNRPVEDLSEWADRLGRDPTRRPRRLGDRRARRARRGADRAGGRIRELLRRERSFSSQVSHQLRTPVAAMRVAIETELDTPRRRQPAVLGEWLGRSTGWNRRSTACWRWPATTNASSRRATSSCAGARPRRALAAELRRRRPGRSWSRPRPTGSAHVDVDAVGHILDVLVENALVHGRGPVAVEVRRGAVATSRSTSRDEGSSRPAVDPFAETASEPATASGCAWPARWPSRRAASSPCSTPAPTVSA